MYEKYEYKIIAECDVPKNVLYAEGTAPKQLQEGALRFQEWLNKLGKEGWIFVGKGENCLIFYRQLK